MRRLLTGWIALAVVCGSLIVSAASAAGATAAAATGVWGKAQQVSGVATLNVGGSAKVSSIACPAADECTALGYYSTNGSFNRLFVVRESHGTWGTPNRFPGSRESTPAARLPARPRAIAPLPAPTRLAAAQAPSSSTRPKASPEFRS
jgi:hypothetical protein